MLRTIIKTQLFKKFNYLRNAKNIKPYHSRNHGQLFKSNKKAFSEQGKVVTRAKMSVRSRFLPNDMEDYISGTLTAIPEEWAKKKIDEYVSEIETNFAPNESNGKDGIYLGTAGISFMFYQLSKLDQYSSQKTALLKSALQYLMPALKVCESEINECDVPAFLLGNCGVYAVAAVVYAALEEKSESSKFMNMYSAACRICKDPSFLLQGSDELFVGRAGYVCGALWMANETFIPIKSEDIFDICRIMIASGKQYSREAKSASPLMYSYYQVEYLGAGHGLASILQMIMSVPGYLDANPGDAKLVKGSVDYLLSLQDAEGNFPASSDEANRGENELLHWCHGAGGVVYVMAKAYMIWSEEKYLNSCKLSAEVIWKKGLLRKGPGLCHGIAGNGYVFLLLYRLTMDEKHLFRAMQFAKFLDDPEFKTNARVPDNPYSLYEGAAGTVCFLGDVMNPDQAAFPFSDVF